MTGSLGLFAVVAMVLFAGVTDALRAKRVVGGTKAAPGEFPYMVSLSYQNQLFCGGAIVGRRHIVTAGHCLESLERDMYPDVRVATGSVLSNAGWNHVISTVTIHPDYKNRQQLDAIHDIGIIELDADIAFDENQSSVDLPTDLVPQGVLANFTGWGYQYTDADAPSLELMKMNVKTVSNEECSSYWAGRSEILSSNICTLSDNRAGICHFDGGGPLVYNGQLIGLASFAIFCARGYPDVYTSVHYYISWIQKTMKSFQPLEIIPLPELIST